MKTKTTRKPAASVPPSKTSAKHSAKKVRFKIKRPKAKTVTLVGSFTQWEANPIPLVELEPGLWTVEIELPSGRHEYLFLTDEGEWLQDSDAITSVANPWGGLNSVVDVEPPESFPT
jgi:1,4-alpha-glucan branching enzyme